MDTQNISLLRIYTYHRTLISTRSRVLHDAHFRQTVTQMMALPSVMLGPGTAVIPELLTSYSIRRHVPSHQEPRVLHTCSHFIYNKVTERVVS